MDAFVAIGKRRSIRKYSSAPIPSEILDRLLEAARLAPSSSNTQSWKFKVVTDPGARKELRQAANNQGFVEEAPAVIACCIDFGAFGERGRRMLELLVKGAVRPSLEMVLRMVKSGRDGDFDPERVVINGVMNVSIAAEHIALAATALGLGTCWVRAFEASEVERIIGVPEGVKVLCLLTVGYPAEDPPARPRRSLDEIRL